MNNGNYRETINNLDTEIKNLRSRKMAVYAEWAEKKHPLKIGDRVVVNGYSFKHKDMIVREVFLRYYLGYEFYATGYVLKKNGEQSKNRGEWSQKVFNK